MPQVLWLGMTISDRIVRMRNLNLVSLASDAAACCLAAGQPEKATELLERGRSLAWSQALSLLADVSDLERDHPVEAAKFKELSGQLTVWSRRGGDHGRPSHPSSAPEGRADGKIPWTQDHRLAHDWNALVNQIRNLPGCQQFLRPAMFSELTKASQGGSIIILNNAKRRNDAIILPPSGAIVIVPLTKIQIVELQEFALDAARGRGRGRRVEGEAQYDDYDETQEPDFSRVTSWLWDNVVSWLIEPLKKLNGPSERIWFCTTGLFTFLPVHAAGPAGYGTSDVLGVIDHFAVSYTPTITALLRVQQRVIRRRDNTIRMLAVGQRYSTYGGFAPLTQTSVELQAIKKYVPSRDCLVLEDHEATVNKVMTELGTRSWIHFCCHGHQDIDPLKSSLHMFDGGLSVEDFARMHIDHAQFAFLSACETATGSESTPSRLTSIEILTTHPYGRFLQARDMPDEAMHLAAGLQFAGFPSVISTLWSIDDYTAPRVAEEVYREMSKSDKAYYDPAGAAVALALAVRKLKKVLPVDRLVPFIHIGL